MSLFYRLLNGAIGYFRRIKILLLASYRARISVFFFQFLFLYFIHSFFAEEKDRPRVLPRELVEKKEGNKGANSAAAAATITAQYINIYTHTHTHASRRCCFSFNIKDPDERLDHNGKRAFNGLVKNSREERRQ